MNRRVLKLGSFCPEVRTFGQKIRPFFNSNIFPPRPHEGVNKNESVLKPGMAFPPAAVLLTFDKFRMLPVGLGFRAPPAMIDKGSMGIFMSFVKFAPEMKIQSIQTYLVWIFWFHRKRYPFYNSNDGNTKVELIEDQANC